MNCEQCQELLSLFLDSELEEPAAASVRAHLSVCGECAAVCEELAAIIDVSALDADAPGSRLDSDAMWERISGSIESDRVSGRAPGAGPRDARPRRRGWKLSLPQAVASIAATVIVSSLLTFVALSGLIWPSTASPDTVAEPSVFERMLATVGLADSREERLRKRIEERRRTIEFWNRKIEARRVQWDGHFRDAFDRNLKEIEQVVGEYSRALEQNPDDPLAEEMLDSALYDQEELLRAFSQL
jgi:uncharacterized protein YukE